MKYTLEDLRKIPKECLTSVQVSSVLGCTSRHFSTIAKTDPQSLGFPVVIIGKRVKIPKDAFLEFMSGGKKNPHE